MAVNDDGKREVLGVATGPNEAETFWTDFLRSLADRGLRGVKLVIADDHKGLRAVARRVFNATHQRCRVHWMRNALAHAPAKTSLSSPSIHDWNPGKGCRRQIAAAQPGRCSADNPSGVSATPCPP